MPAPLVYVVDDDLAVRKSLQWLLESVHLSVKTYGSGDQFLREYDASQPGCLVLDLRLPGMSGLAVLEELARRELAPPAVLISAHGNIPTTVQAMRAGAIRVFEKPYNDQDLLEAIQEGLRRDEEQRARHASRAAARARLAQLTAREREILDRILVGKANKLIAQELGVSEKNVEYHRANIMRKAHAESLAELIRLVLTAEPPA